MSLAGPSSPVVAPFRSLGAAASETLPPTVSAAPLAGADDEDLDIGPEQTRQREQWIQEERERRAAYARASERVHRDLADRAVSVRRHASEGRVLNARHGAPRERRTQSSMSLYDDRVRSGHSTPRGSTSRVLTPQERAHSALAARAVGTGADAREPRSRSDQTMRASRMRTASAPVGVEAWYAGVEVDSALSDSSADTVEGPAQLGGPIHASGEAQRTRASRSSRRARHTERETAPHTPSRNAPSRSRSRPRKVAPRRPTTPPPKKAGDVPGTPSSVDEFEDAASYADPHDHAERERLRVEAEMRARMERASATLAQTLAAEAQEREQAAREREAQLYEALQAQQKAMAAARETLLREKQQRDEEARRQKEAAMVAAALAAEQQRIAAEEAQRQRDAEARAAREREREEQAALAKQKRAEAARREREAAQAAERERLAEEERRERERLAAEEQRAARAAALAREEARQRALAQERKRAAAEAELAQRLLEEKIRAQTESETRARLEQAEALAELTAQERRRRDDELAAEARRIQDERERAEAARRAAARVHQEVERRAVADAERRERARRAAERAAQEAKERETRETLEREAQRLAEEQERETRRLRIEREQREAKERKEREEQARLAHEAKLRQDALDEAERQKKTMAVPIVAHDVQSQRRMVVEQKALKRARAEADAEDRMARIHARRREEALGDDDAASTTETERSATSRASDATDATDWTQLTQLMQKTRLISTKETPMLSSILARQRSSAAASPRGNTSSKGSSTDTDTSTDTNTDTDTDTDTDMVSDTGTDTDTGSDTDTNDDVRLSTPRGSPTRGPMLRFAAAVPGERGAVEAPPPSLRWLAYMMEHRVPASEPPPPPVVLPAAPAKNRGSVRYSMLSLHSTDMSAADDEWAVRPAGPYRDGGVRFLPGFTVHGLADPTYRWTRTRFVPASLNKSGRDELVEVNELSELVFSTPSALRAIVAHLDLRDLRALHDVSRTMRRTVLDRAVHESVLERFLAHTGYRTWSDGPDSVDPLPLTLADCEAYIMYEHMASELAAAGHAYLAANHRLDKRLARLARAGTRAHSKLLARVRMQPAGMAARPLARMSLGPSGMERLEVPALATPGHVATFRAWAPVPLDDSELFGSELQRMERELFIAGIWRFLQRGDVVVNTASHARYIFNGEGFEPLYNAATARAELPPCINALLFPPTYYEYELPPQRAVRMYIDVRPWRDEIMAALQLVRDYVDVVGANKQTYRVAKWVYRSAFHPDMPTEDVPEFLESGYEAHAGWNGTVVVEVEGTSEHVAALIQRCSYAGDPPELAPALLNAVLDGTNSTFEMPPPPEDDSVDAATFAWDLQRHRSEPGLVWFSSTDEHLV